MYNNIVKLTFTCVDNGIPQTITTYCRSFRLTEFGDLHLRNDSNDRFRNFHGVTNLEVCEYYGKVAIAAGRLS